MGRELKRVALDFEWEIGKLWTGYINPHEIHNCSDCNGEGWSKEYKALSKRWYSFDSENRIPNPFNPNSTYIANSWSHNIDDNDVLALIEADRLWDFTRVPLNDEHKELIKKRVESGNNNWLPFSNGYIPTASEVNEWSLKGFGHDSLNKSIIIKAKLKRQGISHLCTSCDGSGENWQSEIAKKNHENWKEYDPPTGNGFQLWTTTSEGSPMTPVFETLDLLCEHCEKERVSVFGSSTATKEEWKEMLGAEFVHHKEGNAIFI